MQVRKFLNRVIRVVIDGVLVLSAALPIGAMESLHYGVRTDVLQPIHRAGSWLWYINLHTQIPSLERSPHFWLVNAVTGVRGVLTPYFILGGYGGFSQLNNRFGRTYTVNAGMECWFPWAKLGMHAYFMNPKIQSKEQVRPLEESSLIKRAIDIKLSATLLPFVRPFLGVYYLVKFSNAASSHQIGSLYPSWGVEWLMTPRCSVEVQNNIGESNLLIRVKLHSAKVRQPPKNERVGYYLQEPLDYYALPIMLLSPDGPDQGVFWRATPAQPTVSFQPQQTQPVRHPIQQQNPVEAIIPPYKLALRPRASSFDDQLMVRYPQPEPPNQIHEQPAPDRLEGSKPCIYVNPDTHKRYGVPPATTERDISWRAGRNAALQRPEGLQRSNTAATVSQPMPTPTVVPPKARPRALSAGQLSNPKPLHPDRLTVYHAEPDRSTRPDPVPQTLLYHTPSQPPLALQSVNPSSFRGVQKPMRSSDSRLLEPVGLPEPQQPVFKQPVFEAPANLPASELPTYSGRSPEVGASVYIPYRRPNNKVHFSENQLASVSTAPSTATAVKRVPPRKPSLKNTGQPTVQSVAFPRNSLVSPKGAPSSSIPGLTNPVEDALPPHPEFKHS